MNKIDLTQCKKLSQILHHIGYHFYKNVGIYFSFDVKMNKVYAIREVNKKKAIKVIIEIENNRICEVNDYLLELFIFPKTEIIVDGWEKYLWE